MTTQIKNRWLGVLLGVCLMVIAAMSIYTWHLSRQLQAVSPATDNTWTENAWPTLGSSSNATPYTNPNDTFSQMQQRMDAMMNSFLSGTHQPFSSSIFSDPVFSASGFGASASSPRITMDETADQYIVIVTVPEGQEVELNTTLNDNQLTVSGTVQRRIENTTNELFGGSRPYSTLSSSQFSQTMALPADIDEAGMDVKHEDSIITIVIPKQLS